jgi:hypothetical protein
MGRSRDLRLSNAGPAAVLAGAVAVPTALLVAIGSSEADDLYVTHMVAVGATMIAGIAAFLLTRAGTRRGDVRAVAVGTAFAAMAALLLIPPSASTAARWPRARRSRSSTPNAEPPSTRRASTLCASCWAPASAPRPRPSA